MEVLKTLPAADSGNVIDEAIHLSEELGLANPEEELPEWDEIVLRLQRCRPDWDWRENLDPYALSQTVPLAELTAPGIYNRAVLFAGTRSPYTYGLEIELRKLMQLDEAAVARHRAGTMAARRKLRLPACRGPSHSGSSARSTPSSGKPWCKGLSAPLTVVTGPPGTGKSQVVTSLLANQAWLQSSVLFSSKNNHAVDVVESRTNELGPYPLLLRLGKEEHHARVAQHLTSGLAESASPDAAARYAWLQRAHRQDCDRFAAVQRQIAAVMSLRNMVDEAGALRRTGARDVRRRAFRRAPLGRPGVAPCTVCGRFAAALDMRPATSAQTAMGRWLGDSRGRRAERVAEIGRDLVRRRRTPGRGALPSEPNEANSG
jgi:hypothetical protein